MKRVKYEYVTCPSNEHKQIASYILQLLRGKQVKIKSGTISMTEKQRQFYTWGANKFHLILSEDGCNGIEFSVMGLKFRGRVRIYYNYATDYFDIEFLYARKNQTRKEYEDVCFDELHNICHCYIERSDDPSV